ncbi:hypothetical protein [Collinsella aerofaciens]|uniref:hypothetical protein n=1 Tax=Collinsella aerofaciens TaxID=74426 RepID=UPI001D01B165|nr:hypothetical protein [Collinsella aerofaciens]MCB5366985.1 hypothetical protein [Collinsella aerofaciens]MCB5369035.1 hypothetical protein [Collinsella aerofaciens]
MSIEERKPLLASLKDTVEFYKERKTVGRMKTEHSVFIPSSLMIDQAKETEDFIKAARYINNKKEWNCPVSAEKVTVVKFSGVEFVFQFSVETDFDAIIRYLEGKLQNTES